ncbi:hypothetical protein BDV30DRAFT_202529, partial [Aspergillus minisclerotigenes]
MVRWASAISRNHLRAALLNGGRGSTVRLTVHSSRWLWTHRCGCNHPSDDRQLLHANLLSSSLNQHTYNGQSSPLVLQELKTFSSSSIVNRLAAGLGASRLSL